MKTGSWSCIPALLLALLGGSYGLAAEKEKVEEGRYGLLKNGALIAGSEHSWTLWQLPDGRFELEDHFQVDKTSRSWSEGMLASGMSMSPELRRSLQESIEPSDLSAIFASDHQLLSLTVRGMKLNGGEGVGVNCRTSPKNVECAGTSEKAKFRVHEPRGLFWWYGIPALLRPWIVSSQEESSGKGQQNIVLLSFGNEAKAGLKPGMKFEPEPKYSGE